MNDLIKSDIITKDSVAEAVASISSSVENGNLNPLKAISVLKWYEAVVTQARKQIIEPALKELAKHGKEKPMMFGWEIEQVEAGVSYDYSACGDVEWEMIDSQIKALTEKKKEREKYLRAITSRQVVVNEETGETYSIYPPVKKSTTTLKFT